MTESCEKCGVRFDTLGLCGCVAGKPDPANDNAVYAAVNNGSGGPDVQWEALPEESAGKLRGLLEAAIAKAEQ